MTDTVTTRATSRELFVKAHGFAGERLEPLEQDASTRRYFRLTGHNLLLMDAPPPNEHPAEFIAVTQYLTYFGVRVPKVHAADPKQGFVLIEDLGNATFTKLLDQGAPEGRLYHLALKELISLQTCCRGKLRGIEVPNYDEHTAVNEAALFTQWYLPARLGHPLNPDDHAEFRTIIAELYRQLPTLEPVLVHRDFHVDNLLLVRSRCAMIDYQDALLGSPVYDLISLIEDARRDVDPCLRTHLIEQWCDQLDVSRAEYQPQAAFWGVQRHCKVAGIFVRLWLRDGKQRYLRHLDRVMQLLEIKISSEESLTTLHHWIKCQLKSSRHGKLTKVPEAIESALDHHQRKTAGEMV